ncbi:MAG TPA: translational GTPase TypA, partial [Thermoleophilia bacterium]|nr:translational GTPase TypA [Thermoleophilia bacterium]
MHAAQTIRNLAIIAHIDHGKTTLIDSIFRAARVFRDNARVEERVMDSGDLERERGITIRSKHCTVEWGGYLINIIDTPGHADFSGEVERVLSMVDSVLLLVDANEGPMPQTRYVLMRALRLGLRPIVVVNKVDRPNADPSGALDRTFDLFVELGADDRQLDFPVLYGSGLEGWIVEDIHEYMKEEHEREERLVDGGGLSPTLLKELADAGMSDLFETIVREVPAPAVDQTAPFRMQVSTLAWSDYIGRIGCGRVLEGQLKVGDELRRVTTARLKPEEPEAGWRVTGTEAARVTHLWVTRGLDNRAVDEVAAGDIVWLAGPEDITLGDTLAAPGLVEAQGGAATVALPPLEIEEPTVSMFFLVNNGPFAGRDGRAATLRQIKDRLERELRANVALRMEDLGRPDGVKVSGRGELHLAILIEEMRREGFELCVSRPEVITHRDEHGKLLEPMEHLVVDAPEEFQGAIIRELSSRKGGLLGVEATGTGVVRLEFSIPTRGLIGYRSSFLTETRGLGVMSSRFTGYGPWRGELPGRERGSLVSQAAGEAASYSLENLQQRATLFVSPMDPVYEGMIVGENARADDMLCNPTKRKQLGNYRSSTKEIDAGLKVPRTLTLERALEWIADDELVEVTPKNVRVRKAVLSTELR